MKKTIGLILTGIILLTGCSENDLENYIAAGKNTMEIDSGIMYADVKADIEYNEEGMTEEELVNLSYYDEIEFSMENKFTETDETVEFINQIYMNFGGMGLDFELYKDEEEMYMRLPILNAYMKIEDFATENYEVEEVDYSEYGEVFKGLADEWREILEDENIIKGDRAYLTTSEGQVKTTIYSINLSEEQMKALIDSVEDVLLGDAGILEDIFEKNGFSSSEKKEVTEEIEQAIKRISIDGINGEAYVDFDNRLVKESFSIALEIDGSGSGEPKVINMEYAITFDKLGEEIILDFPEVTDDMWINQNELNMLTNTIPITN